MLLFLHSLTYSKWHPGQILPILIQLPIKNNCDFRGGTGLGGKILHLSLYDIHWVTNWIFTCLLSCLYNFQILWLFYSMIKRKSCCRHCGVFWLLFIFSPGVYFVYCLLSQITSWEACYMFWILNKINNFLPININTSWIGWFQKGLILPICIAKTLSTDWLSLALFSNAYLF